MVIGKLEVLLPRDQLLLEINFQIMKHFLCVYTADGEILTVDLVTQRQIKSEYSTIINYSLIETFTMTI